MSVPYQATKFGAWLEKRGFTELDWSEFHPQRPLVGFPAQPERMVEEMQLLARLITEDLRIKLANNDEIDSTSELLPAVTCSFTAGDETGWIVVEHIDDRTMRDAIMRLAS